MEEGESWSALWKLCCSTSVISMEGRISQDPELTNNRIGNVRLGRYSNCSVMNI